MVNWFDNPPLSRLCKEKLMVLFFGLQLTSCNLQCIEQSFLYLNLSWSIGYVSFQTRVSPSARDFYYDHHKTGMTNLWQKDSSTPPFVYAHESYPVLVSPGFQDLFKFPFIYSSQNHSNQHSQSLTVHLGRLVYLDHQRKGVRQQRQRQLEWKAIQREGLYNMHIVRSK